jgi:hypothetical protein
MARPIGIDDIGELRSKLALAQDSLDDLLAGVREGDGQDEVNAAGARARAFLGACAAKTDGLIELLRLAQLQRVEIRRMAEARAARQREPSTATASRRT